MNSKPETIEVPKTDRLEIAIEKVENGYLLTQQLPNAYMRAKGYNQFVAKDANELFELIRTLMFARLLITPFDGKLT